MDNNLLSSENVHVLGVQSNGCMMTATIKLQKFMLVGLFCALILTLSVAGQAMPR